jgi:hypothetical protein
MGWWCGLSGRIKALSLNSCTINKESEGKKKKRNDVLNLPVYGQALKISNITLQAEKKTPPKCHQIK